MLNMGPFTSSTSLLGLMVLWAAPGAAFAQDASATADAFAEVMAAGVAVPDRPVGELPPDSIRALAGGYYKLLVQRAKAAGDNETAISCNVSIQRLAGAKKISDILTGKTSDVGISLELPLQAAGGATTKAELNLFRLTKTNGSNCRVEQSYFALRAPGEAFETPLMPIVLNPGLDAQTVEVKFRPWIVQTSNPARMSALWRGVGAFAKLLGPIGTLGSILFDDNGGDRYAVRAQAEASFFSATGLDPSEKPAEGKRPEFDRKLRIVPAKDGATPLNRITASWDLVGKNQALTRISYVVDVDYLASRVVGGKQFKAVADNEFADLLEQESPTGQPWWSITPTVANLAAQKDPKTFSAACAPALADLQRLNLSEPDRMLLLYAIGRAKNDFPADSFNDISCFSGKAASLALARFNIVIPRRTNVNPVADMERSASLLTAALRSPAGLGSGLSPRLDTVVKSAVSVRFSPQFTMLDGKPFGDGTIAATRFLERFKQVSFLNLTGCQVTTWSDAAMPPSSQLDSEQQPVAFLARQGARVFLVVAGLATKTGGPENLPPAMTSLFVTDASATDDPVIEEIRNRMRTLDAALCPRDGAFASFFAAPPPAATVAPIAAGTQNNGVGQ